MMLYPPMAELVEKVGSRYLLVNLVSRRAREISQKAEDNEEPLERKPISIAIDRGIHGQADDKEQGGAVTALPALPFRAFEMSRCLG